MSYLLYITWYHWMTDVQTQPSYGAATQAGRIIMVDK